MSNQFSSKNTFKFVNELYKKAKVKAYRDMLEAHQVSSKSEFIRRSVDGSLESTRYWLAECADKSAKIKRANELWKCGLELYATRHFSPKVLKLSTFKKLNKKSGLLAVLNTANIYCENFLWGHLVIDTDFNKVKNAYENWKIYGMTKNKDKSFWQYANNYYNSYRSYLNKIGAIKQVYKGYWQITDFGKKMTRELNDWYSKKVK